MRPGHFYGVIRLDPASDGALRADGLGGAFGRTAMITVFFDRRLQPAASGSIC
jgi:hypothetical protein